MMKILMEDVKKGDVVDIKAWLYGVTSNTMTRIVTGKRYTIAKELSHHHLHDPMLNHLQVLQLTR